jgi:ribose transport system substrate-binding protein
MQRVAIFGIYCIAIALLSGCGMSVSTTIGPADTAGSGTEQAEASSGAAPTGAGSAATKAPRDGSAASGTAGESKGSSTTKGTIAASLLTLENPFFRVIGDNITSAAKEAGHDAIILSADKDPAKQANQVKDFIVKKVVAIVLSPCESRAIIPAIKEANEAGIPVFTVDIPVEDPQGNGVQIVSQIATDNYGGGREAGQAMIETLGEQGGKVAILHFKQAQSCRLRVSGFRDVIDAHNAATNNRIEIVAELEAGGSKDQGFKAAEDAVQAHADLRGIFAINDPSALGARAALEKAGKASEITIIGFDGQPEGKQAIKDGQIYADPIQFPEKMGTGVVEAILRYYRGEEVAAEQLIPTSLYRKADADADPTLK